MAVKIRLTRTGSRNNAKFRVVASDTRSPRDGRFIEILGWYDPGRAEGANYKLKLQRVEEWISNGAQLSDTVDSMVRQARRDPSFVMSTVENPSVSEETAQVAEAPVAEVAEAAETEPETAPAEEQEVEGAADESAETVA